MIDLDVQKFFDEVPWDLIVKAVRAVTDCRWVLLYVKRWLAAPLQRPDGALEQRSKGTPQGSAVSPILANLFMHYAFDSWMTRNFPGCPFERYADDAIVHCKTRRQAEHVLSRIAARMRRGRLTASPGEDADRLLQGRSAPGRARAHLVHLPRVRLPGTGGAQQERPDLHRLPACDQSRGAQGQERRAPPDADPPAHRPVAGRPGTVAEPHRVRVDQLLRPVLPNRARSPPQARQRLPEALGREEVQAAADPQALQQVAGPDCSRDSPVCSPTGAWPARTKTDQKSPVTGDCHAGICGSPGVRFPRATRLREAQSSASARRDAQPVVPWLSEQVDRVLPASRATRFSGPAPASTSLHDEEVRRPGGRGRPVS